MSIFTIPAGVICKLLIYINRYLVYNCSRLYITTYYEKQVRSDLC